MANGQKVIDPLSLNLYTYTHNNPILYVDPSGYWSTNNIIGGGVLAYIGYGALVSGMAALTVATGGLALVVASATITLGSGAVIYGAYEIGEGLTDENPLRQVMGNQAYYGGMQFASMGSMVGMQYSSQYYQMYGVPARIVQGGRTAWGGPQNLIDSANAAVKGGNTAVGRAFQKHSVREGTAFTGEITGNASRNTQQGMSYVNKILNNSNATFTVRNTNAYGNVLDVRLPGGMGARWTADGKTFIGFLEEYTGR